MNRREVFKVVGSTALLMAVGAEARMEEKDMNRLEMKPENPSKMEKGELKHSPEILLKDKDAKGYTLVEVTVGRNGIIHPSTPDHWIDLISLSIDGKLIGKSHLEPEISRGFASFAVKLDNVKTLTARAGCNLHGIWTTTITI